MTTRLLVLPVAFAALCLAAGCSAPAEPPKADEKPLDEEKVNLSVAPAPRAKEDNLPPPAAEFVARPGKPWPELIVGKWRYVQPKVEEYATTTFEFTRDGKCIHRYRPPEHPKNPKGIQTNTREYRVNGNNLFPPSTHDDGIWVTEHTTLIESLTENELVLSRIRRTRFSLEIAKGEAKRRKIPVEQMLTEWRVEQSQSVYVRLK